MAEWLAYVTPLCISPRFGGCLIIGGHHFNDLLPLATDYVLSDGRSRVAIVSTRLDACTAVISGLAVLLRMRTPNDAELVERRAIRISLRVRGALVEVFALPWGSDARGIDFDGVIFFDLPPAKEALAATLPHWRSRLL